jgi:serine/threonine protein kinase
MPELVRTVGRYGILRELGRGGMATVYLARQEDLDRLVALKELAGFHAADPAFAQRFVRESRLAGSLVHPNVITVFDYFEHAGTPYIAMEYVDRGTLRRHVGRMTLAQIGGVLEGLLAGLAAAEQLGIVHRDLKPENLMVTAAGGVKIADFGIAKATLSADTGAFVTATGTTIGTPPYMAPEQAMGKEVGRWTDLYSVGCIAYELFTGHPPFHDAGEPMAIMVRHITEPLPPVSDVVADVDPAISGWIERLTAKKPEDRPPSATAAWEELEEILLGSLGPRWRREAPLAAPPDPPVPGPATPPPSGPAAPITGIDVEGTGPDTGGDTAYETYNAPPVGPTPTDLARASEPPEAALPEPTPPPGGREAAPLEPTVPPMATPPPAAPEAAPPELATPKEAPQPPAATPPAAPPEPTLPPMDTPQPPAAGWPAMPPAEPSPAAPAADDAGVPRHAALLARAAAGSLVAALLIPLLAEWPDRWNVFAVLSPFEALGVAFSLWVLTTAHHSLSFVAGALLGLGVLISVAALGLLRFTLERLDGLSTMLTIVVLLGAGAAVAAGIGCLRTAPPEATRALNPGPLVLGLAGAALVVVALFVNYDGFSSLWSELQEGESAEFFFEPAVAAGAALAALVLLGSRPRFAGGLLAAVGLAATLHFLGLIVAAARAIGEVGDTRAAGFIGVLGGVLILAAGVLANRG